MTPRRGRCVAELPAIFYTDTTPDVYIGVIKFQIRLQICAYGNGGAGEFVFQSDHTVDTNGQFAIVIVVPMIIGAVIGADVGAGADIPAETGCIAADVAMDLIESCDTEAVVPEARDAFERGVIGDKMFEADRAGPEFNPDGVGVSLAFGLGKGAGCKETD